MASPNSLVFFVLFVALFSGVPGSPSSRMLGGSEAKPEEFPYMVSVRRDFVHVCGGSIISADHILTAAHCVSAVGKTPVDPSAITIRAGSTNHAAGGKLYGVENITIHNSYGSFLNDIAVLKLISSLIEGPKVQIIPLADKSDAVAQGSSVVVAGWGRTEIDGKNAYKLQHSDGTVISIDECEHSIGYGYQSTLCVSHNIGKGACIGDAGGPAVYNGKLVGVNNFVMGSCGTKYPDVYGRVSHFYSWIKSIIDPQ